jgi:hypothetical protein
MSILKYPKEPCSICKSDDWWYTSLDPEYKGEPRWMCGRCYPPKETVKILARIVKGNYVLNKARLEIWKIQDLAEEKQQMAAWQAAYGRLQGLTKQLKVLSVKIECPYIVNRKKVKKCMTALDEIECLTCPTTSNYWWETELFDENEKQERKAEIEARKQKTVTPPGPKLEPKLFDGDQSLF